MKTKILSRMLLSVAIVAISVMMTAGSCKKADVLSIAKALKVTSTVSTQVAVETDAKTGVSTVSIVHVADKGLPKNNTSAEDLTMDFAGVVDGFLQAKTFGHSKEVFTVEIPLATSGIVLSKMRSGDKSEKLEDVATGKILYAADVKETTFKPQDGFAFMPVYTDVAKEVPAYSKTLQFMSGLINKDSYFAPNHKAADVAVENATGLFCRAGAAKIEAADVTNASLVATATLAGSKAEGIKEDTFKDKTFEGAQKASCYTVRNTKVAAADWEATAPEGSVRERALLFVGIETGKATIGDVAKAVPKVFGGKSESDKAEGFNKTSLEGLAKQYPITQVANVVVKMIGKAGSSDGGEK